MKDKKLLTVGDLRKWCNQIYDDHAQIAVTVPLKDIDGYVVNVDDVHYDETSEALILEPCYEQVPDGETFSLSGKAAMSLSASPKVTDDLIFHVEALEEALTKIASYTHFNDDCPEWYKKETLDSMHEDDPEYVEMLAWDESVWYDRWREDHGHEDNEYLEYAVEIARDALHNIRGDFTITGEDGDAFGYEINNSLFGSAKWLGQYFICWHTDGVANDNYLMFEEVDDAKAYLQWIADTDALMDAQIKHGQRFPLPEAPKAKNTGDSMDPFMEFMPIDHFYKVYDKRNKDMTLSQLGFFPEQ